MIEFLKVPSKATGIIIYVNVYYGACVELKGNRGEVHCLLSPMFYPGLKLSHLTIPWKYFKVLKHIFFKKWCQLV